MKLVRSEELRSLFSEAVVVCVATRDMYHSPLPIEEYNVVRDAVTARKQEFAAGRAAAREALQVLGAPKVSIPASLDRSPVWPQGFTGSITHCRGFCGAAVTAKLQHSSLGFDAEVSDDLSPEVLRVVCAPQEIKDFPEYLPAERTTWSQVAFCAKEAFYKCYYPIGQTFLDFADVSIHFHKLRQAGRGSFTATLLSNKLIFAEAAEFAGRWCTCGSIIFAGVSCKAL